MMHIIIVIHDNSLPVLGATSVIPAEHYSSPYLFTGYLMNQLIPLQPQTVNGNAVETVNARELHGFLEVGKDFSSWIKGRLNVLGSIENEDYLLTKIGEQLPSGTKYKTEYYITLDVAKHIAMMEKNDKGLQARQYFIECERKLRENQVKPVPLTFAEALRAYADEVEAHEQTKQTLTIAAPKAQYFDNLVERNLLTNFTTTAKEFGIKRKDFIDYLLDNGYIYRDQQGNLLPYAAHVPTLFEIKEYSKDAHSGVQTLVTPKGRETLRLLLT